MLLIQEAVTAVEEIPGMGEEMIGSVDVIAAKCVHFYSTGHDTCLTFMMMLAFESLKF